MKIGLICPNFPPAIFEGGISHYTGCLVHHLKKNDDEVVVITDDGYMGPEIDGNVTVLKYSNRWDFAIVRQMANELRVREVEIINLQYSPVMYPWQFKMAWNYFNRKFISTISFHTLWGGSKLNKLFALNFLRTTNGIIATNSEVTHLLRTYFPFFLKKSSHIPIGPNIIPMLQNNKEKKEIKAKFSNKLCETIIAYFGMAYPGKGMEILFKTIKLLKRKYNLDIKLFVIGGGVSDVPEYLEEKKKLVHSLGVSDSVIFTGKIAPNEVSELLHASDVVVLPFTSGGSDRRGSLMAAIAHHKAIVTTKPSIAIEHFKNGENMVWADSVNAEHISEKVYDILSDTNYRKKLEKGAKELSCYYRWEDITLQTRQFFHSLLSYERQTKFGQIG